MTDGRYRTEEAARAALHELEGYTEDVTGDACVGDEVAFARATFIGSLRRFAGYEVVTGTIVRENYAAKWHPHTFSIQTADGLRHIKVRDLYSVLTLARPRDPEERQAALERKHRRWGRSHAARESSRGGDW